MRSYEDQYQHHLRSCAAFTSLGLQHLPEGEMVEQVVKLILHLECKKIWCFRLSRIYLYFITKYWLLTWKFLFTGHGFCKDMVLFWEWWFCDEHIEILWFALTCGEAGCGHHMCVGCQFWRQQPRMGGRILPKHIIHQIWGTQSRLLRWIPNPLLCNCPHLLS